jgi:5-methylcytosine-specific restriction endonuclease McrA
MAMTPEEKRASHRRATAAYELRYPERVKATQKRSRDTHKKKRNAYSASYWKKNSVAIARRHKLSYDADPEISRARARQFYAEHTEECRARSTAYHRDNPEKIRAIQKAWRLANPEKARAKSKARKARKKGAPINDLTHAQWLEIQEGQKHRCYYGGKRCKGKLTQDHIIPLSKGGSHTASNVIGACAVCNSKKQAGPPPKPVQPFLFLIASPRKRKAS